MKQREFNLDKFAHFSEWYNTVIYAAELADVRYNVKGFVVNRPWSSMAFKKIYALFEKELEEDGHLPVIFPSVIPEENFEKEKEHVEGFAPEVLWVTKAGKEELKRPLALRPTSETAFYQMYQLWISSFKDLPYKLYQSCSVYRNESETNPFLRGVEFLWIETHNVYATSEEAWEQTRKDGEIMRKVAFESMGIEFLQFQRPKWDTFAGAEATFAYDCLLPDGKALQFGSTHYLGQHFTKAFEVSFLDAEGKRQVPYSTCFGPGIWRMMAAVAAVHGDSKGLIFPFDVAPIQVVIVPIMKGKEDGKDILAYANSVAEALKEAGIKVRIDDSDKNPGFKYNYWELKGVPLRAEVGAREEKEKTVTLVRRTTREKTTVKAAELVQKIKEQAAVLLKELQERSSKWLLDRIREGGDKEGVLRILEEKGIAKAFFCSLEMEGKKCADELKEYTKGGKVRGKRVGEESQGNGCCIMCGKTSSQQAYIARQY